MARKQQKIRAVSYVHVGDRLVCTDDLTQEQKNYVGAMLQVEMLNAAYRGKAEFTANLPPLEQVFPGAAPCGS